MILVYVRACYDVLVQYNIRQNESNACSEELNTFSSCSARPSCATPSHAVLPLQTLASHLNILSADGRALCPRAATSSWVRFIKSGVCQPTISVDLWSKNRICVSSESSIGASVH